jgi:hypothetical protein
MTSTRKPLTADAWEAAWAGYVDALAALDATRPDRWRRGGKRAHGKAGTVYGRAVKRLRKLDPEFCLRNDI